LLLLFKSPALPDLSIADPRHHEFNRGRNVILKQLQFAAAGRHLDQTRAGMLLL